MTMTDGPMTYDGPGLDEAAVPQAPVEDEARPAVPVAVPAPDSAESAFDLLRSRVETRVARKPIRLGVLELPGCEVVYDVNIEWEILQAWRNANRDPETGVPDALRVSQVALATQCREIRFNGQAVRRGGRVCTFTDSEIQDMLGAHDTASAVRRLYANDAHVIIAGDALIAAAGYGDRITKEAADPSPTS